jgi:heme/copper-type cytochrome/quinol oxidase subunit 2
VFVVVEGLLVLAALRLRQTPRQRPTEALPDYRPSWGRELLWTLLPAVALLALGLLGLLGLLGAAPGP